MSDDKQKKPKWEADNRRPLYSGDAPHRESYCNCPAGDFVHGIYRERREIEGKCTHCGCRVRH